MRGNSRAGSLVAALPLLGLVQLGAPAAAGADEPGLLHRIVAGRLSIGVRSSLVHLEDTRRYGPDGLDNANLGTNFLGSLWGLDAEQRPLPLPFLEYRVVSRFGAGVAYDQARARTLDWSNDAHTTTAGDGDVAIHGLQAYLFARGPQWRVTPYAQVGVEHYWSQFYVSPGWATGGRYFAVDPTDGWFVAGGGLLALGAHARVDLQFRHSQTEAVTARAYLYKNHHRDGAFPMRRDELGIGLRWAF